METSQTSSGSPLDGSIPAQTSPGVIEGGGSVLEEEESSNDPQTWGWWWVDCSLESPADRVFMNLPSSDLTQLRLSPLDVWVWGSGIVLWRFPCLGFCWRCNVKLACLSLAVEFMMAEPCRDIWCPQDYKWTRTSGKFWQLHYLCRRRRRIWQAFHSFLVSIWGLKTQKSTLRNSTCCKRRVTAGLLKCWTVPLNLNTSMSTTCSPWRELTLIKIMLIHPDLCPRPLWFWFPRD